MKKFITLAVSAVLAIAAASAQNSIPNVNVTDASGKEVSILSVIPTGKPVVISFWDTACKPCMQELGAFSDNYDDWKDEFDFEIVAVSTDDAKTSSKVFPFTKGRGWPFIVVLDKNGDFKRAMNVQSNPSLFIIDAKGKVVWSHTGYTPGGEDEVHKILSTL